VTGPGPARPATTVLIVSAYAPPHLGGVEVIVAQQAQTLAALGFGVTVVTSRCGGGARRERRDGYDIVRVSAWNVLERRLSVPFPLWSPAALLTIARLTARADIVHVHDAYHPSSVLAALSARSRGRPFFLTQHVAIVSHDTRAVELVQRLYYRILGPALWRRARRITAYNPIVSDFLTGIGVPADMIRLTYNGIDTAEFRPGTADGVAATRARYGIAPDRPVVLFVGRLVPKKGADKLLQAVSPRYQVVLAGPGSVPDDLPDGVIALGPVSRDDLLALYQASDIFAFPATGEMFTLAMQEAMSCGLPVVATGEQGYASYGLDPLGLALVTPEPGVLRATFLEILGDEARMAYMRRYSRLLAQERFDWHKNAASLAADYEVAGNYDSAGDPARAR
jgi:D-inositol-3-phosphate glycosyltransferase